MIKNQGAEQRNAALKKDLLATAITYIGLGHGDAYTQSVMWASRGVHTAIEDIIEAIDAAKVKLNKTATV